MILLRFESVIFLATAYLAVPYFWAMEKKRSENTMQLFDLRKDKSACQQKMSTQYPAFTKCLGLVIAKINKSISISSLYQQYH